MRKLFPALLALSLCVSCGRPAVYDLVCEGLAEPLGIDSTMPHFSWKVDWRDCQTAYRIQIASSVGNLSDGVADIWDSGEVQSADQVFVPYGGPALGSRQLCFWRVKVLAGGRESAWTPARRFAVGIIAPDSMAGEYIGAVPGEGRSAILRKSFTLDAPAENCLLHVNSLGYHEVYVNGEKVSDAVLTPAVSQLDKRSLIVTYDVANLLEDGSNEIAIWTSSGWYKPGTFRAGFDGALVKAELDVDGVCVLATDGSWQGAASGYRDLGTWRPNKFIGEEIDARIVPREPRDFDALAWQAVELARPDSIVATPQMCELCVVKEVVDAVSIEPAGEDRWLVDMGSTYNALPEIVLPQLPEGLEVKASFGDSLDENGAPLPLTWNILISSGREGGDRFQGRFNSHVFRYVVLENLPQAPLSVKAHRMRTDYPIVGSFSCSDPELQSVHDLVMRTMENLAFDGYMVDCANIERLGYGGDGNASTLSLQTVAGVGPLFVNWLQAWNDCIREDGGLPHTAPNPYKAGGGPYWCSFIVQAPWRTYMSYGDPRLLERCYSTMKHWLDYVDAWSYDGLLHKWPNQDYRGWYLGDWLAPHGVPLDDPESVDIVNNCALSQACADLVRIADIVGTAEEKAGFEARLAALNARIHEAFYHPDTGLYATGSQIDMIYPLLVGAVPENLRENVVDTLLERTSRLLDGHVGVGLVGVPVLAEWATLSGQADFVYGMLKKHGYPGYLHMMDCGATGTWESWDGDRSHLHNCYNGIGSWFYQALGGIIPLEPGYRKVSLDPQMPAGLDWVKVSEDTPYGVIKLEWNKSRIRFELPSGVTAVFRGEEYGCGSYSVKI